MFQLEVSIGNLQGAFIGKGPEGMRRIDRESKSRTCNCNASRNEHIPLASVDCRGNDEHSRKGEENKRKNDGALRRPELKVVQDLPVGAGCGCWPAQILTVSFFLSKSILKLKPF